MRTNRMLAAAAAIPALAFIAACSAAALPAKLILKAIPSGSPTPAPSVTPTAVASNSPTPLPSVTPTYTPRLPQWPRLDRGVSGLAEVFALERLLRHRGFAVVADGRFDDQTLSAVKAAQTAWGLPADGIVDAATWEVLVQGVSVGAGDTGEAVRAAQYLLNKFRDPVGIDGMFGAEDLAALEVFKGGVGLQPDGVIDSITWRALVAVKPSVEPAMSNP